MKRVLIAALIGAVFAVLVGSEALAAPLAPRAKTSVAASSSHEIAQPPDDCLNIDRDFRQLCLLGAQPQSSEPCFVVLGVPDIAVLYRCGKKNKQPPGEMCLNIEQDNNVTCLLGATPDASNGDCRAVVGVPGVIVYYRCSGPSFLQNAGQRALRIVRRILP
jgi:hypothetical protein